MCYTDLYLNRKKILRIIINKLYNFTLIIIVRLKIYYSNILYLGNLQLQMNCFQLYKKIYKQNVDKAIIRIILISQNYS